MTSPLKASNLPGLVDPVAVALEILRTNPCKVSAWEKVRPLAPLDLREAVADYVKAAKAKPKKLFTSASPLVGTRVKVCKVCHQDWPHYTPDAKSLHGHYLKLYRTRRDRWSKYPDPSDRRAQNLKARTTILAARRARWVAALRLADPLGVDHLLATQGFEAAVNRFRSLSKRQRRKLLKAVPPPTKRKYKGEFRENPPLVLGGSPGGSTPLGGSS